MEYEEECFRGYDVTIGGRVFHQLRNTKNDWR